MMVDPFETHSRRDQYKPNKHLISVFHITTNGPQKSTSPSTSPSRLKDLSKKGSRTKKSPRKQDQRKATTKSASEGEIISCQTKHQICPAQRER